MWPNSHIRRMSISIKIAIACVTLAWLSAGSSFAEDIHYDGIYRYHEPSKEVSLYLRFYSDGTVLSTASTGKADQVAKWFHRGTNIDSGHYVVDGNDLHFTIFGFKWSNDCAGTIAGNLLMLRCSDSDASLLFEFLPMRLAK
jgi:hypothetical protein